MTQHLLGKILKAGYSGIVAFLGTLGTSLSNTEGFSGVTAQQWVWISLTSLIAVGGTFGLAGWAGPKVGNGQGAS
jgi:hypothetical protein